MQKIVQKLQKKYSPADAHSLRDKIQELKGAIQVLERIEPKSQHELVEKKQLLEAYGRELGKIVNTVHGLQESPSSSAPSQASEDKIQAVAYEEELIVEKARELKAIEGHIIDINHMLKDCAETILEQGKELDTVENFVEISHESSKVAAEELEKANGYQKNSNNCCMYIAIFGVVLAVVIILIYTYM